MVVFAMPKSIDWLINWIRVCVKYIPYFHILSRQASAHIPIQLLSKPDFRGLTYDEDVPLTFASIFITFNCRWWLLELGPGRCICSSEACSHMPKLLLKTDQDRNTSTYTCVYALFQKVLLECSDHGNRPLFSAHGHCYVAFEISSGIQYRVGVILLINTPWYFTENTDIISMTP